MERLFVLVYHTGSEHGCEGRGKGGKKVRKKREKMRFYGD
jgi:hypothetical protein